MIALFESMTNMIVIGVIVLGVMLIIILAMKRLTQHSFAQKATVILANISAGIAVLGLVLGFHYLTDRPLMVVLITSNVSKQFISEFTNENHQVELKWFRLTADAVGNQKAHTARALKQASDDTDKVEKNTIHPVRESSDIVTINNVAQLPLFHPKLNHITVLGDGLTKDEWQLLSSQYPANDTPNKQGETKFDKPASASLYIQHKGYSPRLGLIKVKWQKQVVLGQQGLITGQLQTPNDTDKKFYNLALIDPFNKELEVQTLTSNDNFSFIFTGNIPGQWLYRLELTERSQPTNTLSQNVGIQVINAKPVKLMIKQSSPSFETRHLQNLITEQGGTVLTLTKISKNKDIRQQINVNQTDAALFDAPFSQQSLNYFDALIIDQQALSGLSPSESEALDLAIQDGLGVIIQAQSQQVALWPASNFKWLDAITMSEIPNSLENSKANYLRWQYQILDIPITSIQANLESTKALTLVSEQNNRPLVMTLERGLGHVAVSLINTTHTWKTQGRPDLHSHYWQWIFSQIMRGNNDANWQIKLQQAPVLAQQPVQHCVANTQEMSGINLLQGSLNTALAMNTLLLDANMGCVNYSPFTQGWYSLEARSVTQGSSDVAIYANDRNSWEAWQQDQRYRASADILRYQTAKNARPALRTLTLSSYWFWALLLVSLLILWLERKYFA